MDRSSSAKCLLYSDVMKGESSPTGRGGRSRDEKGNQGVGDIRFTNKYFIPFFYSFLFFNYFTLSLFFYTFFTHDIYPHPHSRPTTSTHHPRPTTFSYTLDRQFLLWRLLFIARGTRNAIWGVTVIVAFVVYLQFDAAECYGCNFFYIQILLIFR